MGHIRLRWVAALTLVGASWCAVVAAQEAKPPAAAPVGAVQQEAKGLPADCVAYIHTENLATLIQNADLFIGAIMPGMNAQLALLKLGEMIKNPSLMGVDQSRPMTMVILNPKKYPECAAMVISVTDGAQFLAGVAPMAKDMGQEEGIHTLQASEFDRAAFQKAAPEEKKNIQQFVVPSNFYTAVCGKTVVFAKDKTVCATVKEWVTTGQLDLSKSLPAKGDLVACANVKSLMEIYAPEIDERVAPFLSTLEQAAKAAQATAPQAGPMNPAVLPKILKLEVDALVALAQQMDQAALGLDLRAEGARARVVLTFKPETAAVRFIAAQKAAKPDLVRFIPADAPVIGEFSFVLTPEIKDFYLSFVRSLYELSEKVAADPALMERHLQLMKECLSLGEGDVALGFLAGGEGQAGFTLVAVQKNPDPAKSMRLMTEVMSAQGSLMDLYAGMGMKMNIKVTEKAETFEGVEIAEAEMDLGATASPEAAKAMEMIYGYPMKLRYGVMEDKFLVAMGKNAADRMHQVIGLIKKGGGDALESPDLKSLLAGFPPTTNGFLALSPGPLISAIMPMPEPAAKDAAAPKPMPPAITGAIGGYVTMSGNTITGELTVPMEVVLSVKDALMMGGMGGPRRPPQPGGGPGPGAAPGAPAPPPGGLAPAPAPAPEKPAPAPAPKAPAPAQP